MAYTRYSIYAVARKNQSTFSEVMNKNQIYYSFPKQGV